MSYLTLLSGGGFSNASIFAAVHHAVHQRQHYSAADGGHPSAGADGEGRRGRPEKLGQITRYVTVGLGLMLGVAYYFMVKNNYNALVRKPKRGAACGSARS